MKKLIVITSLLLATGGVSAGAAAPCSGQIHPNPGFERGTAGWTAGPRIVVLGAAHSGSLGWRPLVRVVGDLEDQLVVATQRAAREPQLRAAAPLARQRGRCA